jgi:hypothetical protein
VVSRVLIFSITILTVAARSSISPPQADVALGNMTGVQQSFAFLVRKVTAVENDMNSVERVIHYSKNIEQEAPCEIQQKKPEASGVSRSSMRLELPAWVTGRFDANITVL